MGYKKVIVDYDAEQHTNLVKSIPAETELKVYNIFRHANFREKRIVDIGCGDGNICREAINRGAKYVLGIDSNPDMIKIAVKSSESYKDKIDYIKAFIEDTKGDESFDIAILSYLLNNAISLEQLIAQCKGVASLLKKRGVAIVYNNNPFDINGGDFSKYGFSKTITGINEGDKIIFDYRPVIEKYIINFYLNPESHENAFMEAGFSKFRWEALKLMEGSDENFWKDFFNREHLPVIGMVAVK